MLLVVEKVGGALLLGADLYDVATEAPPFPPPPPPPEADADAEYAGDNAATRRVNPSGLDAGCTSPTGDRDSACTLAANPSELLAVRVRSLPDHIVAAEEGEVECDGGDGDEDPTCISMSGLA